MSQELSVGIASLVRRNVLHQIGILPTYLDMFPTHEEIRVHKLQYNTQFGVLEHNLKSLHINLFLYICVFVCLFEAPQEVGQ